jgi:hypothetical protein
MGMTVGHIAFAVRSAFLLGWMVAGYPARVWAGPASVLEVESGPAGAVELDARRAKITEVLRALAAEGGFDVVLDDAVVRPPVNATLEMAPVEDVLREVLRDRNYALVYDGDDRLSQVILLAPSAPTKPAAARRQPAARAKRNATRDRGPIVIRF